ncbi:MAG: hypothetical protein ACSHX9_16335 [Luteolibacter sp.]
MLYYFANIDSPKRILWCYLIWYIAIVAQYFEPLTNMWLSSVGIAALIGYALNLAASQKGRTTDKWVVFRLYVFPFCVSSYSALIKGKGFLLLFPGELKPFAIASAACAVFVGFTILCRSISARSGRRTAV